MISTYPDSNSNNDNNNSFDAQNLSTKQTNLYSKIQEGLNDIILGNTRPFAEAMADVKVKRSK